MGYQAMPDYEHWVSGRIVWPRKSSFSKSWMLPGSRGFFYTRPVIPTPRNAFHLEQWETLWATQADLAVRKLQGHEIVISDESDVRYMD